MNIDKIFELFNKSTPDIYNINKDYEKHPLYLIGMFKKLILNCDVFEYQLVKFFKRLDKNVNEEDINKVGKHIIFNKAWFYIQQINSLDATHQIFLNKLADIDLMYTLELSIQYFQDIEEYEKCAYLKRNLDFIKLFLT